MKIQALVLLIICLTFNLSLFAEEKLSDVDQEALRNTQKLLNDASDRQEFIDKSKDAQKTDQMVDQLVKSPEQKARMYKLASEIFGDMVKGAEGDADKMAELLQQGAKDPESFMRKLSSENQKKIQGLAEDIEKTSGNVPSK